MTTATLPFEIGVIYEAIVTTYTLENKPNAAPMGFILHNDGKITLACYEGSDTHQNLQTQEEGIINITNDPELFVKSTLFQETFVPDDFLPSKMIKAPILKSCEKSYIALKVVKELKEDEKSLFVCEVNHYELNKYVIYPYNRAFSSLIEILIHTTRIIPFAQSRGVNDPEVRRLLDLINHHSEIITRVTGKNSPYMGYLDEIMDKISRDVKKKVKNE
jgi:hypothetical protein